MEIWSQVWFGKRVLALTCVAGKYGQGMEVARALHTCVTPDGGRHTLLDRQPYSNIHVCVLHLTLAL